MKQKGPDETEPPKPPEPGSITDPYLHECLAIATDYAQLLNGRVPGAITVPALRRPKDGKDDKDGQDEADPWIMSQPRD